MNTLRRSLLLAAILFVSACAQIAQQQPDAVQPPPVSSATSDLPDPVASLQSMQLPGAWKAIPVFNDAVVALPSVAANFGPAGASDAEHDNFSVMFLRQQQCTQSYAQEQVEMNWGTPAPAKYTPKAFATQDGQQAGYSWQALDGVAGGDTSPQYRHWCIHHPQPGMDINISASIADTATQQYMTQTFVPLWLATQQ